MDSQIRSWLLMAVCVSLLVGCSGETDHPATVAVSGTVTEQGAALAGVQVAFTSKEGGARKAIGTTDAEGKYRLTTFEPNDGAVVGAHTVSIVRAATAGESATGGGEGDDFVDPSEAMAEVMAGGEAPEGSEGEPISDREATVTADGPNVFDFDI